MEEKQEFEKERRIWKNITKEEITNNWEISVNLKTRLEEATEVIPESLYAPIIYQVIVRVKNIVLNSQIILAKIIVVDTVTNEPILKNGKIIMAGCNEFALNYDKECKEYAALTKLQFTDCSFHYLKKGFSWMLTLYLPNENEKTFSYT